jgi:hypothetical protein
MKTIVKVGRNEPCPCGKRKSDGKPKKFKHCCEEAVKAGKKTVFTFGRRDLISGPYIQCPECSRSTFGVFVSIAGTNGYSRECTECGHQKGFPLPKIKKKVLYLDQFVISNLIKLLDKDHKSHETIKADPFWTELFIRLEKASKSQAIVCPDSFYHRDESLVSGIDFRLMKRLYEHFSSGKTLHPSHQIEQTQIYEHFRSWLRGEKFRFDFSREQVSQEDLDTWDVGLHVTVNMRPFPGEIDNLRTTNSATREQLKSIWSRWQSEKDFRFIDRVNEETLALGKGLVAAAQRFRQRRAAAMARLASGESHDFGLNDLNDLLPPVSNGILDGMLLAARQEKVPENEILNRIAAYFADANRLLEVPKVRISSVMFAGLARRAQLGKKHPPKSFADVGFISSYLPYCDAMFVDIESRSLIKELPRETPKHLRLDDFKAQVFSLNQRDDFLAYLDGIVASIPSDQMTALQDMQGEDYGKPYWEIIEYEKRERAREMRDQTE